MIPGTLPLPRPRWPGDRGGARAGQALVEVGLWIPIVLLLLCGMWGGFLVLRAALGLETAAREAARAGALAASAATAQVDGIARGQAVAADYGLGPAQELAIAVTLPDGFARGGAVQADVGARVRLSAVPFLGRVEVRLASRHRERIDRWRSFRPSP